MKKTLANTSPCTTRTQRVSTISIRCGSTKTANWTSRKLRKNTYADRLIDGLQNEELLFAHPFQPGDTVTVELWSIDRAAYNFYTTLNSVSDNNGGGPFSGVPDNPITNLTNGAYGFFGASAVTRSTVVIQ
ncbi:MAG: DUF4249 family protein [Flavobacteriales bacterium]|nr:DUF4249 family protein [Flavobacteriales bacterium]